MKVIGFLTPYRHLREFKKLVSNNYICLDLSKLSKEDQIDSFKHCNYIFSAPNYQKFIITDDHLQNTNINMIISPSTGTNHINVNSIPIVSINKDKVLENIWSTAEHALYLLLAITRHKKEIEELHSNNLGILGYGRLGTMVKKLCRPLFHKIYIKDLTVETENFFDEVDFLSINIDLNKQNEKFINKDFINKFKKSIYIVNTSRGEVVNEQDIVELIQNGKVLGYATDVIQNEHSNNRPYLKTIKDPRILITPHVGGTGISSQERAYKRAIEKILN